MMLWISLLFAMLVMWLGWLYEGRKNNASIVDVLWAALMMLLPIGYGLNGTGDIMLRLVVPAIMSLWYLRLVWHLSQRVFSEPEDGRYRHLRKHWGDKAHRNHFFFFQAQAILAWALTLPVWWLTQQSDASKVLVLLAVVWVIAAWIGVTIADKQLAAFRQDPANKGKVCENGLWHYSRHPNYFFEWLHWFSYPLIGLSLTGGVWLWLMPLVMLLFLYFVTGIPYTEQQALRSRGEAYRRYQKTTSAFIPWRKKHVND